MEASALSAPAGLHRASVTSRLLTLRSDDQLVAVFRSGNDDAFRVIHDRYRQRLFSYARQMLGGSRSDAEDVLQDVFLRAYRALRADERPVSLRAWLYRVAHNRCVDQLRRPVPAPADVFQVSRSPLHDPLVEAEQREDLQRLVADVRRLPDQQRSALLMREMDGMSYAELAAALETSVPAVKSLLVRARIGLVEAIEARDADCADIRHDLAASYDRGVRASGRARRHLRDCAACTIYRAQLREVREGFAALSPGPLPVSILAKLLGIGGAGSGAAAGSGTAVVGGGAVAASATKVAVVCCAAALSGGAAREVTRIVSPPQLSRAQHRHVVATPQVPSAGTAGTTRSAGRVLLSPAGPTARSRQGFPAEGLTAPAARRNRADDELAPQGYSVGPQENPAEEPAPVDGTADPTPKATAPVTDLLGAGASADTATGTGSGSSGSDGSSSGSASATGSSATASSADSGSTTADSGSGSASGSGSSTPPPSGSGTAT